jgi:hypothetical protein
MGGGAGNTPGWLMDFLIGRLAGRGRRWLCSFFRSGVPRAGGGLCRGGLFFWFGGRGGAIFGISLGLWISRVLFRVDLLFLVFLFFTLVFFGSMQECGAWASLRRRGSLRVCVLHVLVPILHVY